MRLEKSGLQFFQLLLGEDGAMAPLALAARRRHRRQTGADDQVIGIAARLMVVVVMRRECPASLVVW